MSNVLKLVSMNAQLIEKEMISSLHFKRSNVIEKGNMHTEMLLAKLKRATALGNLHHIKIAIFFKDEEGIKEVRTTIWATGEKYILLKSGTFIPISSIVDIKF